LIWWALPAAGAGITVLIRTLMAAFGIGSMPAMAANGPLHDPLAQELWDAYFKPRWGGFREFGPYPGESLDAPGDCSITQHSDLRDAQKAACRNYGSLCKKTSDPAKKQEYFDKQTACIDARLEVMFTCFRGGDQGHWEQVRNQVNSLKSCFCSLGE
jgi:hypothetical protein